MTGTLINHRLPETFMSEHEAVPGVCHPVISLGELLKGKMAGSHHLFNVHVLEW